MKEDRAYYHKRYYRIKTLKKLRSRIKVLKEVISMFKKSPEGRDFFNRKTKEYQKQYRDNNKGEL